MFPSSHPTESWPRMINGTPLASPPDRAPRDYQPPPRVERSTTSKRQPYNPLGPSDRPIKYAQIPDKTPHDERPLPGVEKTTPTKHQPANPPGPSYRPINASPSQTKCRPTSHVPGEAPTHPPAKSTLVLPLNMPVNFIQKIPNIVRLKTLSHPFTNNSAILV